MGLLLRYCQHSLLRAGLIAIASFGIALPAFGEGSQQLGSGDQGLNVFLFEYDATNSFIQGTNRPLKLNVENANDVINISLCGWSLGDDLAIEIFRPSGAELNYTTQVSTASPGSFVAGAWRLTAENARTPTQTTLCNNRSQPTPPVGSVLSNPVRFTAPEAGTYEIRLFNDSQSAGNQNNVFTYFDITVTPDASTNPNPSSNNGQLWATSWAFNANNTFLAAGGYDADLYIRTPGARLNTEFIWQLDLNNFAPQRHELIANGIGLDAPDSRSSALGSSGASYTRDFPIYVSPPNPNSIVLPILPEPAPPSIENLGFIDSDNQDSSISPNSTTTVQDAGFFRFETDIAGTYKITIDTNLNGVYDNGDRVLFGSTTVGVNSIQWDGFGPGGTVLPSNTYSAQIDIGLGEYHFVTFDAETSGGGQNDGLSIWKWNSLTGTRSPVRNYWDDTKVDSNDASNLSGGLSGTPDGNHTWGSFSPSGNSIGNQNFIDTWVFGDPQISTTSAIIADVDDNDFGDAPDIYGTNVDTSIGGTPASHLISPNLYLGLNSPDIETDGQPSPNSDGDDLNGSAPDDEDGLISVSAPTNTSFRTTVKVNNTSGNDAYLVGWIDFDRNSLFDDSERVIYDADTTTVGIQPIPTGTTNSDVVLTWSGLSPLMAGNVYARFRLTTDTNIANSTTASSTGAAIDGEVEDYRFPITLPVTTTPELLLIKRITAIQGQSINPNDQTTLLNQFVDDTASAYQDADNNPGWPVDYLKGAMNAGLVKPGDTVEYTVYFLNSGSAPAAEIRLCDRLQLGLSFQFGAYDAGATDIKLHLGDLNTGTSYDLTAANDLGPTGDRAQLVLAGTNPSKCNLSAANDNGTLVIDITGGPDTGAPALTELTHSTGQGTPNDSYGFFRFTVKVDE